MKPVYCSHFGLCYHRTWIPGRTLCGGLFPSNKPKYKPEITHLCLRVVSNFHVFIFHLGVYFSSFMNQFKVHLCLILFAATEKTTTLFHLSILLLSLSTVKAYCMYCVHKVYVCCDCIWGEVVRKVPTWCRSSRLWIPKASWDVGGC